MRSKQAGITAIGWLFLLTPFAVVIYGGIRLAPIYLNYMKVAKAIETAGNEVKGDLNATTLRIAIDKHFEIDMVEYPTIKDIKISRDGAAWLVEAQYDDEAPLFGNLSLHVAFDKQKRFGGGGGE